MVEFLRYREKEPNTPVSILEVGPARESMAIRLYQHFLNPSVVFVAPYKDPEFNSQVANFLFVELDLMDYLGGHISIPSRGFDYIVMQNVLSASSGKLRSLEQLARGLHPIVKSQGTVFIEESYTKWARNDPNRLAEYFTHEGFVTGVTREPSMFIMPSFNVHEDAFHLEATKK